MPSITTNGVPPPRIEIVLRLSSPAEPFTINPGERPANPCVILVTGISFNSSVLTEDTAETRDLLVDVV